MFAINISFGSYSATHTCLKGWVICKSLCTLASEFIFYQNILYQLLESVTGLSLFVAENCLLVTRLFAWKD